MKIRNKKQGAFTLCILIFIVVAMIFISWSMFRQEKSQRELDLDRETRRIARIVATNLQKRLVKLINFSGSVFADDLSSEKSVRFNAKGLFVLFPEIKHVRILNVTNIVESSNDNPNCLDNGYNIENVGTELFCIYKNNFVLNLSAGSGYTIQFILDPKLMLKYVVSYVSGDYCVYIKSLNDNGGLALVGGDNLKRFQNEQIAVNVEDNYAVVVVPGERELQSLDYTPKHLFFMIGCIFIVVIVLLEMHALERNKEIQRVSNQQLKLVAAETFKRTDKLKLNISRTLHDEVGHDLTLAIMSLDQDFSDLVKDKKSFDRGVLYIKHGLQKIRDICKNLSPPLVEDMGWINATKAMLDEVSKSLELPVDINIEEPAFELSKDVQLNIYRVIKETMTNIVKHSYASAVNVSAKMVKSSFVIIISDDGIGFDKKQLTGKGVGLISIQERCENINAKLDIQSKKYLGTTVSITLFS